ncbi:MAG: hypothetical protein WA851_11455 [Xanthobacteraceae bacterium]
MKRPEIDRRLAAGEPAARIARDYELNPSSLYRHRVNCLKLGSSNAIMKETARGTAAVALLPSKETLSGAYFELRTRIDQIAAQAQAEGSLSVAISGLNSLRQPLDSLSRLAGHDRAGSTEVNVAVQTNVGLDLTKIAERLIGRFDHEPDLKARIAQAVMEMDDE